MRKLIPLVSFIVSGILLAGCTTPQPYGDFSAAQPEVAHRLADAAVDQLSLRMPPANTRLSLQQPATDAFGQALLVSLRTRGYAVREFNPDALTPSAEAGVPLRYVVDHGARITAYRVSLIVAGKAMSRAFSTANGAPAPDGAWTVEE
ncbi:hypothetical protein [Pandoraea apista]|uniref:hypothetical protein n=1 Tax=Pandoraea apista TaxID=93218 RepID=UPI000658DA5F|nr:hypothetical protein [Pandoraea apista]ALS68409.1 hypothetical protein AT395_25030 [Pandoraea apista]CFB60433.1 Conjugal transfer protein TrbH [Pandoraea apista]